MENHFESPRAGLTAGVPRDMEAPREGGLHAPPQLFEPRFIVSSLCGACPGAVSSPPRTHTVPSPHSAEPSGRPLRFRVSCVSGGGGGGGGAPQNSTATARWGGPPPACAAPRRDAPPRAARAPAAHAPRRQTPAPRASMLPRPRMGSPPSSLSSCLGTRSGPPAGYYTLFNLDARARGYIRVRRAGRECEPRGVAGRGGTLAVPPRSRPCPSPAFM